MKPDPVILDFPPQIVRAAAAQQIEVIRQGIADIDAELKSMRPFVWQMRGWAGLSVFGAMWTIYGALQPVEGWEIFQWLIAILCVACAAHAIYRAEFLPIKFRALRKRGLDQIKKLEHLTHE